jgi:MFS family permease
MLFFAAAALRIPQVLGFMSSSISFGGAFGFALSASVVSVLLAVLDEHQMNLWGWRIPFITCIVPGLISLALRYGMHARMCCIVAPRGAERCRLV